MLWKIKIFQDYLRGDSTPVISNNICLLNLFWFKQFISNYQWIRSYCAGNILGNSCWKRSGCVSALKRSLRSFVRDANSIETTLFTNLTNNLSWEKCNSCISNTNGYVSRVNTHKQELNKMDAIFDYMDPVLD